MSIFQKKQRKAHNMKRGWKLYLMALLAVAVLGAGCGKNETPPAKTGTEAAKPTEETKKDTVTPGTTDVAPKGPICQSCAMPMTKTEDFGTNADKTSNNEYCCYCYQNGTFINPDMTPAQMIDMCTSIMCKKMNMPESQARKIMQDCIPNLKRWQKVKQNPVEQK